MDMVNLKMKSVLALGRKVRGSSRTRHQTRHAPHPIPAGQEGLACPITGLFADGSHTKEGASAEAAFAVLEADPDIKEERRTLEQGKAEAKTFQVAAASILLAQGKSCPEPIRCVPLNVIGRAHRASNETRCLVRAVGGLPTLLRFTSFFYKKCFADPHVDQFIRRHDDPHGERFATWVMEKFGEGTPWTDARRTRERDVMKIGGSTEVVAYDRSSAHFDAWHSPTRPAHKWGQHFQPGDARVWMRLHFWSAREAGLFEPQHAAFMDYYTRFIGHFISVYSSKSPPFTRESARWSANPQNIQRYLASGNLMTDVIDQPLEKALQDLPADERVYTGSGQHNSSWPYELAPLR